MKNNFVAMRSVSALADDAVTATEEKDEKG